MANAIPSIACLGVIGRNNNPLHITIFPSHTPSASASSTTTTTTTTPAPLRTPLQYSLLLSSTLDVFDSRARHAASSNATLLSGDYGLLHAVDERLAAYGFETNTGVKFVAVVDMRGRIPGYRHTRGSASGSGSAGLGPGEGAGAGVGVGIRGGVGLREGELKVVFRAMQTAYVRLLQNPFYEPEAAAGAMGAGVGVGKVGGKRITSRRFADEMRRIGEQWAPGVTTL